MGEPGVMLIKQTRQADLSLWTERVFLPAPQLCTDSFEDPVVLQVVK